MKTFKQFLGESKSVRYTNDTVPTRREIANREHEENIDQANSLDENPESSKNIHPAFQKAIRKFAGDKKSFIEAVKNSKVIRLKKGMNISNTEMGQDPDTIENQKKRRAVDKDISNNAPLHRPIVLRHTDEEGKVHHHLLAGNTRATTIFHHGEYPEAYAVDC